MNGNSQNTSSTTPPAPTALSGSALVQDTTGLWHTPDYSVCRSENGPPINLDPFGAKLMEAFNSWAKQGLGDMWFKTVLDEMDRLTDHRDLQTRILQSYNKRPDHLFQRLRVWGTLVGPGSRRGTYRMLV